MEIEARPSPDTAVYGSFLLGCSEFAIAASVIKDVINAPDSCVRQPLAPDYVLGVLNLRGMTIPVIRLRDMFSLPPDDSPLSHSKVAIIEYEGLHVGLVFDRTGEVFQGARSEFVKYNDKTDSLVTQGAFSFDGGQRIVQVLDTRRLIELDGLPQIRNRPEQAARQSSIRAKRGSRQQSISFRLGFSELACAIQEVREIIVVDSVENDALANELCIGTTHLRGQTIPLIDTARLLRLESEITGLDLSKKRVIICRQGERTVGLVVNEICSILHYHADELMPFPAISVDGSDVFAGCIMNTEGEEVFQIDLPRLLTGTEITSSIEAYSELYRVVNDDQAEEQISHAGSREAFLTFSIDRVYAANLLDIIEVVDYPINLLKPPALGGGFDGLMNLRGDLISVVNAQKLYGLAGETYEWRQVIVFEQEGNRYGLAIQSVHGISHVFERDRQALPASMLSGGSALYEDVKEAILHSSQADEEMEDLLILDLKAIGRRLAPNLAA